MRLACADFSFPLLPHRLALRLIADMGFEGVDVGLFGGGAQLSPDTVLARVPQSAQELSKQVAGCGLKLADIFLIPGSFDVLAANHPDAAERNKSRALFQRCLEFVVLCQGKHMTALPGIFWKGESHADSVSRACSELAWRVEQAAAADIEFSVEPHLESVVETPEATIELLRRTPGLTVTLDYTHFTYQGIPDDRIETLIPHASHFHARGAATHRLQTPLQQNVIDYPGIVRAMARVGYRGFVGVEYCWDEWQQCNEVDVLSETILMRDLLRGAAN
ncbi:MAG: sugar phosphate isomerase/epimerase [Pirellulales bacterium]